MAAGKKGKRPRQTAFFGFLGSQHQRDTRDFVGVFECDCGWRCERMGRLYSLVIVCPVCRAPKTMHAVIWRKSALAAT